MMHDFSAIRAIAFDLDGTLADSVPGLAQAMDQALYALELPAAGQQRIAGWVGNGADVLAERALNWALAQQANPLQQRPSPAQPYASQPHAPPPPHQQHMLRQLFDHYYQTAVIGGSVLYPGVADTLRQLHAHGFPLAIITNKPSPFIAPLLAALHIDHYFQLILGGDDVTRKKPHPAPLYLTLAKSGLLAAQLLFVGDSRNDILAAQAAGCPCIGMSYGYNYGEPIGLSNPHRVLDHFADLLTLPGLFDPHFQDTQHD